MNAARLFQQRFDSDNGQVKDLVKVFDFAVVEQCYAKK